ncbi:MAG: hypothetical protein HQL84_11415 [Magnetococcales bacterium]|nr:hypothetical protein [Magnetococcales bacterium]MBF0150643.1 hypothetical protein [Magnetococcales bacterium]
MKHDEQSGRGAGRDDTVLFNPCNAIVGRDRNPEGTHGVAPLKGERHQVVIGGERVGQIDLRQE